MSVQLELPKQTGCERVLTILQNAKGAWVSGLYKKAGCMIHSRVADLRRQGHRIECQHIKGKGWCYRLVDDGNASALRGSGEEK